MTTVANEKMLAWLIPAGLILLSLVPVAAGAFRIAELTGGAEVTPENARFFASPLPVAVHIIFGAPGELPRALLTLAPAASAGVGAGWVINLGVAEWIIRKRPAHPPRTSQSLSKRSPASSVGLTN
jgi:hypothetical protein